jgi:hypothetical protein
MSIEQEAGRSEVGVVLENAPKLQKAYGKLLGALLTWKALSAVKPRNILTTLVVSIVSVAAAVFWPK